MGLFDWISRREDSNAEEPLPEFPWDRRPSLYDHVRAYLRPDGAGIEAGQTLPDEERIVAGSPIRWAAGAMDGVATHHMGGSDPDAAAELLRRVLAYGRSPTAVNKLAVYEFVIEQRVVSLVDPFLTSLSEQERLDHARLYDLARSLATESPDREPTKLGLALLGLFGREEDLQIFRTLGRHDEFTLYCAVALGNTEEAEQELYDLARSVEGWGRVHCVERLARIAERSDVKDWLLVDGYKNGVMVEYLAYSCAVGGGLLDALSRDEIDRGLLDSAGEILRALIAGGPAEGLADYEDGPALVTHYLRHAEARPPAVGDLRTVLAIRDFVEGDEDLEARSVQGWSDAVREDLRMRCRAIQGRPEWRAYVEAGLRSEDEQIFYDASQVARAVGVEAWPFHWARLQASPLDSGRWFHAVHGCDADRIGEVIALAERSLPLESIATGPGQETGLGPGFEAHHCLDFILQDLGRFPSQGSRLIEVGLRSPVVRNRNMALKTLSDWGQGQWPAGMAEILEQARDAEPDPQLRRRIENLIAGRPLDDGQDESDA